MQLTDQEQTRILELKQIGFEVIDTGIRNPHSASGVSASYWKYMRGHSVGALFPYPEAAWRDAIKTWDETCAKSAEKPGIFRHSTLSPSQLNVLKSFKSQGGTWDAVTAKTAYLTDLMLKSGLTINVTKAKEMYISLSAEPLPIDAMKRALELADYTFDFTARKGWHCPQLPVENDTGYLETVIKAAWKHALDKGIDETALVSVARGCNMTDADVKGLLKSMFPKPPEKEDVFTMPIKDMKTVLEAAGYTFTDVGGWFLPSMERKLMGDMTAAVCNAWVHCVNKGSN